MAINRDNESAEDDEAVFDWKKNGFDKHERLSLRINAKEADNYNARKKNQSLKGSRPEKLAAGLKKIRKKIREVYDDEEDDEENDTIFAPIQYAKEEDNPLLNALNEDEKRLFYQKQNIENVNKLQSAGKMEALHIANNLARESGLKEISRKAVARGMQEATFRPEEMQEKVIKKEVSGKLGIKGKIEDGKIISAARGIKKIEQMGGKEAAKNLDMRDVVKAGEEKLDEIKLAELILEKSGQDVKKRKERFKSGKERLRLKNFEQPKEKDKQKNDAVKKKNLDLGR